MHSALDASFLPTMSASSGLSFMGFVSPAPLGILAGFRAGKNRAKVEGNPAVGSESRARIKPRQEQSASLWTRGGSELDSEAREPARDNTGVQSGGESQPSVRHNCKGAKVLEIVALGYTYQFRPVQSGARGGENESLPTSIPFRRFSLAAGTERKELPASPLFRPV